MQKIFCFVGPHFFKCLLLKWNAKIFLHLSKNSCIAKKISALQKNFCICQKIFAFVKKIFADVKKFLQMSKFFLKKCFSREKQLFSRWSTVFVQMSKFSSKVVFFSVPKSTTPADCRKREFDFCLAVSFPRSTTWLKMCVVICRIWNCAQTLRAERLQGARSILVNFLQNYSFFKISGI